MKRIHTSKSCARDFTVMMLIKTMVLVRVASMLSKFVISTAASIKLRLVYRDTQSLLLKLS